MAKVFISYSRKDIAFAKRLTGEFQKSELDFWIDWEGIPPTVDWWKEIEKGIEESDAFLFLISPDSSSSNVCRQDIDHAIKNGKRLLPIVVRETNGHEIHSKLKLLNWIFFRETDDFDASIKTLLTSIHTDYIWVQAHRQLQIKALEWERNQKENSFLLRGKELEDADLQLVKNSSKDPYPTQLQSDYVFESRKNENNQKRMSQRRRNIISIVGVILLIMVVLGVTGQLNQFIYKPLDMEDYWVTVPAGEFLMGNSDEQVAAVQILCPNCDFSVEQPQHWVDLPEYQIGKYEVTNRQYDQCVKAGICSVVINAIPRPELHPVVTVTWYDAKTFCEWVGGRLPTEAEWEKAASWDDVTRTKRIYPWGDTIDCSYANYYGKDGGNDFCVSDTTTTPVGSYESGKSPYGLFDMAGNVVEWTSSLFQPYPYSATDEREDMSSFDMRILRDGAWVDEDFFLRSTTRRREYPAITNYNIGFRCARDSFP